ncbi:IS66 family insertion sequence element accessory protein TnpB [Duganella margarita]|uniref:IS66 family insertion sequence element accessory protein TnpB n=1 Tax=Duganella margarita TaxID=2692170 RepID=UPI00192975E4
MLWIYLDGLVLRTVVRKNNRRHCNSAVFALIKVLWFDGDGMCLFTKRLEHARFCLAAGTRWHGIADKGADVDALGKHRSARATTNCGMYDDRIETSAQISCKHSTGSAYWGHAKCLFRDRRTGEAGCVGAAGIAARRVRTVDGAGAKTRCARWSHRGPGADAG